MGKVVRGDHQVLDVLALLGRGLQAGVRVLDGVIQLLHQLVLLRRALGSPTTAGEDVEQAGAGRTARGCLTPPGAAAELLKRRSF